MKTLNTIEQVSKAQYVRLLDVFLLGPAMIVAGTSKKNKMDKNLKTLLLLTGVGTVIYNGGNWLENNKRIMKQAYAPFHVNQK